MARVLRVQKGGWGLDAWSPGHSVDCTSRLGPSPESPLASAGPGSQQNLTEGLPNAAPLLHHLKKQEQVLEEKWSRHFLIQASLPTNASGRAWSIKKAFPGMIHPIPYWNKTKSSCLFHLVQWYLKGQLTTLGVMRVSSEENSVCPQRLMAWCGWRGETDTWLTRITSSWSECFCKVTKYFGKIISTASVKSFVGK